MGKKKENKTEKKKNEDQEAEMPEKPKKQTMQGDNLWPRVAELWDAVHDGKMESLHPARRCSRKLLHCLHILDSFVFFMDQICTLFCTLSIDIISCG